MAKGDRETKGGREVRSTAGTGGLATTVASWAALAGVGVLFMMTSSRNAEFERSQSAFTTRLASVEGKLGTVGTKLDQIAARQAPQGPDPNKVYPVKTEGSPAVGPATAAVTIAEFSDFQ